MVATWEENRILRGIGHCVRICNSPLTSHHSVLVCALLISKVSANFLSLPSNFVGWSGLILSFKLLQNLKTCVTVPSRRLNLLKSPILVMVVIPHESLVSNPTVGLSLAQSSAAQSGGMDSLDSTPSSSISWTASGDIPGPFLHVRSSCGDVPCDRISQWRI